MAKFETPTTKATKATRALIKATYPGVTGITVATRMGFGTAASQVTYPAGIDFQALRDAAMDAGALSVIGGDYATTITWGNA
jgi:hypothetical protein